LDRLTDIRDARHPLPGVSILCNLLKPTTFWKSPSLLL
jgi:hypothetical protein